MRMFSVGRFLALLMLFQFALTAGSFAQPVEVELTVLPGRPTRQDDVMLHIELTNDSMDPCHYAVRLFAAHGGLTVFDRDEDDHVITLRGRLIPHFVAPVDVVPCVVPRIAQAAPKRRHDERCTVTFLSSA